MKNGLQPLLSCFPDVVIVEIHACPFEIRGVPLRIRPERTAPDNNLPGLMVARGGKRISISRTLNFVLRHGGLSFRDVFYEHRGDDGDKIVYVFVFARRHNMPPAAIPRFLNGLLHGTFSNLGAVYCNPRQDGAGRQYRMDAIQVIAPTRRSAHRELVLAGARYEVVELPSAEPVPADAPEEASE